MFFHEYFDGYLAFKLANCRVIGVLTSDLSGLQTYMFDKRTGANLEERYQIDYAILFTFYSANVEVELEFKGWFQSPCTDFIKPCPSICWPFLSLSRHFLHQIANKIDL
jgi:hypothetical protein